MQVTPVKHYSEPSFPTRSILDERPELLRLVPKRWQRNPVVLAALTGLCALALGTRALADDTVFRPGVKVAPIFEHGEGQGGFGCIAVNPPVFLSEDEARKVILEEAKRNGINFKADSLTLDSLPVPITDRYEFMERDMPKASGRPFHWQVFRLDGTDAARSISFEYVSNEDFESWERRPETTSCTASEYDIKGAAVALQKNFVAFASKGNYVVFYDPCIGYQDAKKAPGFKIDYKAKDMTAEYEKLRWKARELSSDLLRKQVRDFIKWLKTEGVI